MKKPFIDDRVFIFDFEVTAYDWLVVIKEVGVDGHYFIYHNDNEELSVFMDAFNPLLCGFNNKHYDDFILRAILMNFSLEEVKEVNDAIIRDGISGWNIPMLRQSGVYFDSFDLMDDCQVGTSLKSIEGHLGMDITESSISFDIDHAWSQEELNEMIYYCKHDVNATEELFWLRESYLKNKISLAKIKNISVRKALRMTNAKLTAVYLDAKLPDKPYTDERHYLYPRTLHVEWIPTEVLDFYDRMHDPQVPDEELFSSKLNLLLKEETLVTVSFGGIHGAIPCYQEEAKPGRSIRNKDVSSYYPHQMIINGYCSRNIPSPQVYADVVADRLKAKKAGDKEKANALKLIVNTAYGAMLNGKGDTAYNELYDPLNARSVCISGQLQLLELTMHLIHECPSIRIIQLNTDGIMVSLDDADLPKWEEITSEWESRTGFELEEDVIKKIVQKDVNNYIEVPVEGKPKLKGGALVRGIAQAGAFKINNNATVIADAIREYFVSGILPEDLIQADNEILHYQFIAKASHKYTDVWQEVGEKQIPCQRVNRVYASKDYANGTIYKKHVTGMVTKESGLPAHCIIDNRNDVTIKQIDKAWYVRQAWKLIRDFTGEEAPKVNTRKINSLIKETLAML